MSCKECGGVIPKKIVVDGKTRNLQNRTRCLKCSPFDTAQAKKSIEESRQRNRNKQKNYYDRVVKRDGVDPTHQRRVKRKSLLVSLCGGSCQICGYKKCIANLAFHHIRDKKFNLQTRQLTRPFDDIIKEVVKCVLVCHNCHGEIHSAMIAEEIVIKKNKLINDITIKSDKLW